MMLALAKRIADETISVSGVNLMDTRALWSGMACSETVSQPLIVIYVIRFLYSNVNVGLA